MATIQGVYVALFGRPADPLGLSFFNNATGNGANLSAIGDLAATKEYTDRFAGLTNNAIVASIYQSLFNRDAEPAGLAFFVDALNRGTLSINNIAIAILDGAQGNDRLIVDTKIASADLFTKAIDTPVEIGSYSGNAAAAVGRAFLADITTTPKTIAQADTAVALLGALGTVGKTDIVLTAGADIVSTTTTNVAFKATDFNDTISTTGTNWDPNADTVDAGFGTDSFNISNAASFASVQVDRLKNVESINVTADGQSSAILNVASAKELTQVWNSASTKALLVDGIALSVTAGIKGPISDTTTFSYANADGPADAATISLSGATTLSGKAVIINSIETLTFTNVGISSLAGGITGSTLKSVFLSGSGTFTGDFATVANGIVETLDAFALAGTITTDLTNLNAIRSYVGGPGSDRVIIDGEHSNDVAINLGGGADTLRLTNAGAQDTKAVVIALEAGGDLVTIDTNIGNVKDVDTNANFLKTLITITDFGKSEDSIKFDVINPATDRETLLLAQAVGIEGAPDLLSAAKLAANATAVGKLLTFGYKGDTYIFQNAGSAAFDAGDTLIKLTGASVSDLTSGAFELI